MSKSISTQEPMNHPLTDEIIENILLNRYWWELEPCQDALRDAADWQLEQVIKQWEEVINSNKTDIQVIREFDKRLKAMGEGEL